jgi:hypothetical protein
LSGGGIAGALLGRWDELLGPSGEKKMREKRNQQASNQCIGQ